MTDAKFNGFFSAQDPSKSATRQSFAKLTKQLDDRPFAFSARRSSASLSRFIKAGADPGNTIAKAFNAGSFPTKTSFVYRNAVGRGDRDFYAVDVSSTINVAIVVQNLSAKPISGAILDSAGNVVVNPSVGKLAFNIPAKRARFIGFEQVPPERYFLRFSGTGTPNRYRVSITAG